MRLTHSTSLSLLISSHLAPKEFGNLKGRCIFCGELTDKGFKPKLGENFLDYPLMTSGDVICPHCMLLLKSSDFRRKSWVVNPSSINFMKAKETLQFIINPPDPPFAIYVTFSGKKHGWIAMMKRGVSFSKNRFMVGNDGNLISISREEATLLVNLASELLTSGFKKSELLGLRPRAERLAKIGIEKWKEFERAYWKVGEAASVLLIKLL